MWFTSDNAGPAHPKVMEALSAANEGYAASYGADAIMERVRDRIREEFEAPDAAVYLVSTGTTANALALATLCPPWSTVYCHKNAHIEEDECGAPEFYTGGAKLTLLDGADAKIDPASLDLALDHAAHAGVHNVQRGVLSLTNATENGAIYNPAEVAELTKRAKAHGLPCHMDGARFANALMRLNCSPAELTWKAGIDALSFGGTKNGLMAVEAVVLFDAEKAWEFELRRKRGGHLFSKHRFLSAQMEAYLTDDLWREMARASNGMADRLAEGVEAMEDAKLLHPPQANMVFAEFSRPAHERAAKAGAKYYNWPREPKADDASWGARLVCNWSTTETDVSNILAALQG